MREGHRLRRQDVQRVGHTLHVQRLNAASRSNWFEGSDHTRWARNLARDARVGFGTQVGSRAVMCEGAVDVVRGVAEPLAAKIAAEYRGKYGRTYQYRPEAQQYVKGHVLRAPPTKVIVFDVKTFNASATRFTFSG